MIYDTELIPFCHFQAFLAFQIHLHSHCEFKWKIVSPTDKTTFHPNEISWNFENKMVMKKYSSFIHRFLDDELFFGPEIKYESNDSKVFS